MPSFGYHRFRPFLGIVPETGQGKARMNVTRSFFFLHEGAGEAHAGTIGGRQTIDMARAPHIRGIGESSRTHTLMAVLARCMCVVRVQDCACDETPCSGNIRTMRHADVVWRARGEGNCLVAIASPRVIADSPLSPWLCFESFVIATHCFRKFPRNCLQQCWETYLAPSQKSQTRCGHCCFPQVVMDVTVWLEPIREHIE